MELVQVIKENGKLRVKALNPEKSDTYIKFPSNLRKEGKIFAVDEIDWVGNCWTAKGEIVEVIKKNVKIPKKEVPIWEIDIELYDPDWNYKAKVEAQLKELCKVYKASKPQTSDSYEYHLWNTHIKGTKTEARAIATLIKRDLKKKFPKAEITVIHD